MNKDIRRRESLILAAAGLAGRQDCLCGTGRGRGPAEGLLQQWRLRNFPGRGILFHQQSKELLALSSFFTHRKCKLRSEANESLSAASVTVRPLIPMGK